jgi:hypothetical protein
VAGTAAHVLSLARRRTVALAVVRRTEVRATLHHSPVVLGHLTGNELPSAACAKISTALNRPLPDTCGQIPLFAASKLKEAQRAVRAFDHAVIALLILTPLLVVAALWLSRRRRRTLLQLVLGTMLVMVILRRAVMWLQNDLIKTGRPENTGARRVIVHQLLHNFFTVSVWVLVIAAAIVAVALVTGPYGWAVKLRGWVSSGTSTTVRFVRNAVSGHQVAGLWVRGHLDLLRIGGGVLAVLLILVSNVSLVWLLVILALLAAYEFWLYRIGAGTPTAAAAEAGPSG